MTRKALICGGRDYSDVYKMFHVLDSARDDWFGITSIIHGNARGADQIAERWAKSRRILSKAYPADWAKHGKAAGPIRNQQMLDEGRPDLVLAFDGGSGTQDMMLRAMRAGIRVFKVEGTSWRLINESVPA